MNITINNIHKIIDVSGCRTLRDVLELVLTDMDTSNSVLHHVLLNGKEMTEEQHYHSELIPVGEVRTLEVSMSTPREIGIESIKIASGQLMDVVDEAKKTANFFRYNDEAEANERLIVLVEIFEKFVSILDLLKRALNIDFSTITTEDKSLAELHGEMTEILNRILQSQQNHDWIALADLLEFELAPILLIWSKIIPTLACPTSGAPN